MANYYCEQADSESGAAAPVNPPPPQHSLYDPGVPICLFAITGTPLSRGKIYPRLGNW